jgi:hypothetical protein
LKLLIFNVLSIAILTYTSAIYGQSKSQKFCFELYGSTFNLEADASIIVGFSDPLSEKSINSFYSVINAGKYQPIIDSLIQYKEKHHLNDWFYYQLIRRTAQQISPKAENYNRYTLYKWFFLTKSGYDATLGIVNDQLLFYVRTDDDISDIPFYISDRKQYMCLNYHDFGNIDFEKYKTYRVNTSTPEAKNSFSYRITQFPDFKPEDYTEKDLEFYYGQQDYHFKIKLSPEVESLFVNYPVVDFETYFNIPLSRETYGSLIPALKKAVRGMNQKQGVDYLMHFTRNAFLYEDDDENFGKEKRLFPEQTLFYDHSDCDDRVALFFYLVKEIYNLPMIALLYPTHITMAVQFNKPVGKPVVYNGEKYTLCEPTPQRQDLRIGQLAAKYQAQSYQVVYQYKP